MSINRLPALSVVSVIRVWVPSITPSPFNLAAFANPKTFARIQSMGFFKNVNNPAGINFFKKSINRLPGSVSDFSIIDCASSTVPPAIRAIAFSPKNVLRIQWRGFLKNFINPAGIIADRILPKRPVRVVSSPIVSPWASSTLANASAGVFHPNNPKTQLIGDIIKSTTPSGSTAFNNFANRPTAVPAITSALSEVDFRSLSSLDPNFNQLTNI